MSLAFAVPRGSPALMAAPVEPSTSLRPEPRRVEVGELIALPILAAPNGVPLDLDLVAGGGPAVLVLLRDAAPGGPDGVRTLLASARALAAARSAVLMVVVPTRPSALNAPSNAVVAVDAGLRFAHMLGLKEVLSADRGGSAVLLAVNAVGCVTRLEVNGARHDEPARGSDVCRHGAGRLPQPGAAGPGEEGRRAASRSGSPGGSDTSRRSPR